MATKLPWEITVDILSLLPPNDLLRFRSVCKTWRSLIDSTDFIKLHLSRCSETRIIFGERKELSWVDPEALDSPQRLDFRAAPKYGVNVIGSCNGLIAEADLKGAVAIWNLSTRRHVTLPAVVHPPLFTFFQISLLGFGYDPVSDDYKMVRLINYRRAINEPAGFHEVKVYSLRARVWKRAGDFPDHLGYDNPSIGVLAHGALHWLVVQASNNSDALLAFDLASEASREFPMPSYKDRGTGKNTCMRVGNLGGRLCVAMLGDINTALRRSEQVDVWVMSEYGVEDSWTKLCSVGPTSPAAPFHSTIPLMYLKEKGGGSGSRVLMNWDGKRFVVYNVEKKTVEEVRGPGVSRISDTFVCLRSLVGVGGDEESKKKLMSGNKKRDDFLSKGFKLTL